MTDTIESLRAEWAATHGELHEAKRLLREAAQLMRVYDSTLTDKQQLASIRGRHRALISQADERANPQWLTQRLTEIAVKAAQAEENAKAMTRELEELRHKFGNLRRVVADVAEAMGTSYDPERPGDLAPFARGFAAGQKSTTA